MAKSCHIPKALVTTWKVLRVNSKDRAVGRLTCAGAEQWQYNMGARPLILPYPLSAGACRELETDASLAFSKAR